MKACPADPHPKATCDPLGNHLTTGLVAFLFGLVYFWPAGFGLFVVAIAVAFELLRSTCLCGGSPNRCDDCRRLLRRMTKREKLLAGVGITVGALIALPFLDSWSLVPALEGIGVGAFLGGIAGVTLTWFLEEDLDDPQWCDCPTD